MSDAYNFSTDFKLDTQVEHNTLDIYGYVDMIYIDADCQQFRVVTVSSDDSLQFNWFKQSDLSLLDELDENDCKETYHTFFGINDKVVIRNLEMVVTIKGITICKGGVLYSVTWVDALGKVNEYTFYESELEVFVE